MGNSNSHESDCGLDSNSTNPESKPDTVARLDALHTLGMQAKSCRLLIDDKPGLHRLLARLDTLQSQSSVVMRLVFQWLDTNVLRGNPTARSVLRWLGVVEIYRIVAGRK